MEGRVRANAERQKHGGISDGVRMFESLLEWLIRLFQLTEEEQRDAGIRIGDPREEEAVDE
ncbi:MAG: hypothetical protein ACXWNQ_04685 [Anaerolineales bacterium]